MSRSEGRVARMGERVRERRDAIVRRWVDGMLSVYPKDSAARFLKERDPFANPLGNTVREGAAGLFDSLTGAMDPVDNLLRPTRYSEGIVYEGDSFLRGRH